MIPEGQAFCRHCGTYLDKDERGAVSHLCPDGHREERFLTGENIGRVGRSGELLWTLACGCTQSTGGRWARSMAQHVERGCCHPTEFNCITHGWTVAVKVDPYVALYLPIPDEAA